MCLCAFTALTLLVVRQEGHPACTVKTEWWGSGVVICLQRGADWHMAQLMPLPLTVSCFSKIQIGFTFLLPAHPGSPGKGLLNVCVCVCVNYSLQQRSRPPNVGLPSPSFPLLFPSPSLSNHRCHTVDHSGPCNSFYCLGHFKNVYDDDDDNHNAYWLSAARTLNMTTL